MGLCARMQRRDSRDVRAKMGRTTSQGSAVLQQISRELADQSDEIQTSLACQVRLLSQRMA